ESRHPSHQALSTQLLDAIMPYCGNALRLGVTGTPGAGKSTFLEAFGMLLIREGLKVAVIAVEIFIREQVMQYFFFGLLTQ
ncbi:hypothetical protein ACUOFC_64095, partial [Escherichia sp. TWPC-MK]